MKFWKIVTIIGLVCLAIIAGAFLAEKIKGDTVQVLRTWTAPADIKGDGTSRAVASYDLRYSTAPITSANFNSALQVAGMKSPKQPGQAESCYVSVKDDAHYWYAIKSIDSAGNISAISNIIDEVTADRTAPQPVADLK